MTNAERIPWPPNWIVIELFDRITACAIEEAPNLPEPYSRLLELLADCKHGSLLESAFRQPPTYRQLAYIAHRVGMDTAERSLWYKAAENIGLTQRHAGHIIARLDEAERGVSELEAMLEANPAE